MSHIAGILTCKNKFNLFMSIQLHENAGIKGSQL